MRFLGLIVVIAALWYFLAPTSKPLVTPTSSPNTGEVVVRYTDQGFEPSSVNVAVGQTVTWVNETSRGMWVASAMHPTHVVYSGTSLAEHCGTDLQAGAFDACKGYAPGESFSFTFTKEGTWGYHDHIDASNHGTVVVTNNVQ